MNCNYIKIHLIAPTPPISHPRCPSPQFQSWCGAMLLRMGNLPPSQKESFFISQGLSITSTSSERGTVWRAALPPTEALTDWIVCRPCTGNGCCVFLSVLALLHPASSISQTSHPPESSTSQTLPPRPPAPVFSLPSLLRCSLSLLVRELILSSLSAAGEHLSLQPEGGRSMG